MESFYIQGTDEEVNQELCGIVACASENNHNVARMIKKGLKRLEYRGYDSIGVATIQNEVIFLRKDAGKIDDVDLDLNFLRGNTGLGHTRWATHGAPNKNNAHPHLDCSGKTAIAHNGIVENYLGLRKSLIQKGHIFKSDTDTEVIAHLFEEYLGEGFDPIIAFKKVISEIEGSFAIAAISAHIPKTIFLARKDSPLVVGIKDRIVFAASDIPAFLEYTNRVIILRNGDIAVATPQNLEIERGGKLVTPKPITVTWTADMAQKSGYPHFMLKEIHEQPRSIRMTLQLPEELLQNCVSLLLNAEKTFVLACGTSYHAGLVFYYNWVKTLNRVSYPVIASEYATISPLIDKDTTIIAISQSGETLDVMKPLTDAKKRGARTLAVCNVLDSSIPRMCDQTIYTRAGPEIGVAATKTHTSQLAALSRLILDAAKMAGTILPSEYNEYLRTLNELPNRAQSVINKHELGAKRLASKIKNRQSAFFLARGVNLPIAMEGALKLKEIAYIHAEAYPAGESKHGPIALVDKNFPVVFISPTDDLQHKLLGNIEEMKARGGNIISIVGENCKDIKSRSDVFFSIPETNLSLINPVLYGLVPQMLAYYTGVERGYDPDKPRNLAKTVTVE